MAHRNLSSRPRLNSRMLHDLFVMRRDSILSADRRSGSHRRGCRQRRCGRVSMTAAGNGEDRKTGTKKAQNEAWQKRRVQAFLLPNKVAPGSMHCCNCYYSNTASRCQARQKSLRRVHGSFGSGCGEGRGPSRTGTSPSQCRRPMLTPRYEPGPLTQVW